MQLEKTINNWRPVFNHSKQFAYNFLYFSVIVISMMFVLQAQNWGYWK